MSDTDYKKKYLTLVKDKKTGEVKLKRAFTNYTVEKYNGNLTDFYEILVHFNKKYPKNWIDSKINGFYGYLMSVEEWKKCCDCGNFIDYDGYGDILDINYSYICNSRPSARNKLPETSRYIMWYNR